MNTSIALETQDAVKNLKVLAAALEEAGLKGTTLEANLKKLQESIEKVKVGNYSAKIKGDFKNPGEMVGALNGIRASIQKQVAKDVEDINYFYRMVAKELEGLRLAKKGQFDSDLVNIAKKGVGSLNQFRGSVPVKRGDPRPIPETGYNTDELVKIQRVRHKMPSGNEVGIAVQDVMLSINEEIETYVKNASKGLGFKDLDSVNPEDIFTDYLVKQKKKLAAYFEDAEKRRNPLTDTETGGPEPLSPESLKLSKKANNVFKELSKFYNAINAEWMTDDHGKRISKKMKDSLEREMGEGGRLDFGPNGPSAEALFEVIRRNEGVRGYMSHAVRGEEREFNPDYDIDKDSLMDSDQLKQMADEVVLMGEKLEESINKINDAVSDSDMTGAGGAVQDGTGAGQSVVIEPEKVILNNPEESAAEKSAEPPAGVQESRISDDAAVDLLKQIEESGDVFKELLEEVLLESGVKFSDMFKEFDDEWKGIIDNAVNEGSSAFSWMMMKFCTDFWKNAEQSMPPVPRLNPRQARNQGSNPNSAPSYAGPENPAGDLPADKKSGNKFYIRGGEFSARNSDKIFSKDELRELTKRGLDIREQTSTGYGRNALAGQLNAERKIREEGIDTARKAISVQKDFYKSIKEGTGGLVSLGGAFKQEFMDSLQSSHGMNLGQMFKDAFFTSRKSKATDKVFDDYGRKTDEILATDTMFNDSAFESTLKALKEFDSFAKKIRADYKDPGFSNDAVFEGLKNGKFSRFEFMKSLGDDSKNALKKTVTDGLFESIKGNKKDKTTVLGGIAKDKGGSAAMSKAMGAGAGVATAAVIIGKLGKEIGKLADSSIKAYEGIQKLQTQMSVVFANTSQSDTMFTEISEYAKKSPFGVEQMTQQAILLKQSGVYTSDLMDTMKRIGDLSSGNEEKMKSISDVYARVMSSTTVTARDMRQLSNAGVASYSALADATGTDRSLIRSQLQAGKITSQDFKKMIETLTNEGGTFYGATEKGAKTIGARKQNLSDANQLMLSEIGRWFATFGGNSTQDSFYGGVLTLSENINDGIHDVVKVANDRRTADSVDKYIKELEKQEEKKSKKEAKGQNTAKENKEIERLTSLIYGQQGGATAAKTVLWERSKSILEEEYGKGFSVYRRRDENYSFEPENRLKVRDSKGEEFDEAELADARMLEDYLEYWLDELFKRASEAGQKGADLIDAAVNEIDTALDDVENAQNRLNDLNASQTRMSAARRDWNQNSPVAQMMLKDATEQRNNTLKQRIEYFEGKTLNESTGEYDFSRLGIEEFDEAARMISSEVRKLDIDFESGHIWDQIKQEVTEDGAETLKIARDNFKEVYAALLGDGGEEVIGRSGMEAMAKLISALSGDLSKMDRAGLESLMELFNTVNEAADNAEKNGGKKGEAAAHIIRSAQTETSRDTSNAKYLNKRKQAVLWAQILSQTTGISAERVQGVGAAAAMNAYRDNFSQRQMFSTLGKALMANGSSVKQLSDILKSSHTGVDGYGHDLYNWNNATAEAEKLASAQSVETQQALINAYQQQIETLNELEMSGIATRDQWDNVGALAAQLGTGFNLAAEEMADGTYRFTEATIQTAEEMKKALNGKKLIEEIKLYLRQDLEETRGNTRAAVMATAALNGNLLGVEGRTTEERIKIGELSTNVFNEVTSSDPKTLEKLLQEGNADEEFIKALGDVTGELNEATKPLEYDEVDDKSRPIFDEKGIKGNEGWLLSSLKSGKYNEEKNKPNIFSQKVYDNAIAELRGMQGTLIAAISTKAESLSGDTTVPSDYVKRYADEYLRGTGLNFTSNNVEEFAKILAVALKNADWDSIMAGSAVGNGKAGWYKGYNGETEKYRPVASFEKKKVLKDGEGNKGNQSLTNAINKLISLAKENKIPLEKMPAAMKALTLIYPALGSEIQENIDATRDNTQALLQKSRAEEDSKARDALTEWNKMYGLYGKGDTAEKEKLLYSERAFGDMDELSPLRRSVNTDTNEKILSFLGLPDDVNYKAAMKRFGESFVAANKTEDGYTNDFNNLMGRFLSDNLNQMMGKAASRGAKIKGLDLSDNNGFQIENADDMNAGQLKKELMAKADEMPLFDESGAVNADNLKNYLDLMNELGLSTENLSSKMAEFAGAEYAALETMINGLKEIKSSLKSFGLNSILTTTKLIGENVYKMDHSLMTQEESADAIKKSLAGQASALLDEISKTSVVAGFNLISAGAKLGSGGIGMIAAGLGLVAAGGFGSFGAGMLSAYANDDSKDKDDNELERLEALKDNLANLLKQARDDAEYYEVNLRNKKAISTNADVSAQQIAVTKTNDMILSPNGVFSTHPDDYIMAMKDPASLIGGGSSGAGPNINFNIINASGTPLTVEKSEKKKKDNGDFDLTAVVNGIVQKSMLDGEYDNTFATMKAANDGAQVSA